MTLYDEKPNDTLKESESKWKENELRNTLSKTPESKEQFLSVSGREIDRLYIPEPKTDFDYLDDYLAYYRVHEDNESKNTKEEIKLMKETRKILDDDSIKITSTAVRVPIEKCHGESINLEFYNEFDLEDIIETLGGSPGLKVMDDINNNLYPMPIEAANNDEVYVGRIRRDHSVENGLNLWIVSDNLRKGAATNTIQIAETLIEKGLL